MKIKEFNCETGEEIERDATVEEIAQSEKDAQIAATEAQVRLNAAAEKAKVLERLGISEEEAQLLLS